MDMTYETPADHRARLGRRLHPWSGSGPQWDGIFDFSRAPPRTGTAAAAS